VTRVEDGSWARLKELEGMMSAQVRTLVEELPPDQLLTMRARYGRRGSWLLGAGGPVFYAGILLGKRPDSAVVERGGLVLAVAGAVAFAFGTMMVIKPDFFIRAALRRRVLRSNHALADEYASTLTPVSRPRDAVR
jgi:hypothetical protein